MVSDFGSCLRGCFESDGFGSVVPPIYVSTAFRFVGDGSDAVSDRGFPFKYGREESPSCRCLERVLACFEGGVDALVFSSGMGALASVLLSVVKEGLRVVAPLEGYSTSLQLIEYLSRLVGFELVRAWPSADGILEAVGDERAFVFTEVMTNPTLKVVDVSRVASSLPEGSFLFIDNTFTTPYLVRPLELGAGAVMNSLTKYLAGHNDVFGGVVTGSEDFIKGVWEWRRMLGTAMQPIEAYLTLRGVKTFEVRFEKVSKSALAIAEFLEDHPRVEEVLYPGLESSPYHELASRLFKKDLYGGVLSFRIRGTFSDAASIMRRLSIITPAPSLGGPESLISAPAVSASRYIPSEVRLRLGITESLLRLSVGLEDPETLIEDLSRGLGS